MLSRLLAALRVRKLLLVALAVGVACALLSPEDQRSVTRGLIGWIAGVSLYLALMAHAMSRADHDKMVRTSAAHAEGARTVLAIVVLAALVSLVAIVFEVSAAKGHGNRAGWPQLASALGTVVCSWLLLPTLFTLSYASLYYVEPGGGLRFPDGGADADTAFQPDYGDFAYFAFTIAVASQTSDVAIDSRPMRRLVLVQSVLSFAFNTTILALTINLAAGMFAA